jgi:hypothetical protein
MPASARAFCAGLAAHVGIVPIAGSRLLELRHPDHERANYHSDLPNLLLAASNP